MWVFANVAQFFNHGVVARCHRRPRHRGRCVGCDAYGMAGSGGFAFGRYVAQFGWIANCALHVPTFHGPRLVALSHQRLGQPPLLCDWAGAGRFADVGFNSDFDGRGGGGRACDCPKRLARHSHLYPAKTGRQSAPDPPQFDYGGGGRVFDLSGCARYRLGGVAPCSQPVAAFGTAIAGLFDCARRWICLAQPAPSGCGQLTALRPRSDAPQCRKRFPLWRPYRATFQAW